MHYFETLKFCNYIIEQIYCLTTFFTNLFMSMRVLRLSLMNRNTDAKRLTIIHFCLIKSFSATCKRYYKYIIINIKLIYYNVLFFSIKILKLYILSSNRTLQIFCSFLCYTVKINCNI